MATSDTRTLRLGNRIAPPRFLLFIALVAIGVPIGVSLAGWRLGGMAAFDVAALIFLASCTPLLGKEADDMRQLSKRNDANRFGLLVVTGIVSIAVLVAVAAELNQKGTPKPIEVACVIATLAIAWVFSNTVYALHYAHLFYTENAKERGKDSGGVSFPDTDEPDYWDFVYFAFCLGMTFQTSDVEINNGTFRKTVTAHCLAAFVFNLGVIAFTINVLGGSS
ncbi:DUF1345 domain-containing protein [Sphingomonas sp. BIUV-7]|uniref:DUF1345 domain-containing protein n=1 Tax=Sphingomonas natans TaxID=3063330 RepID=A0ABT8Y6T6_9SPHN|nr:DUF1345 domain-containing protein [Sphingomonas sp. BIUV-7]MDO6414019.1 DUF1345 domain-containing protein [Sphingomonas sp. BIUV-7]